MKLTTPHGREAVRSRLGPCPNLLTLRPHANRSHLFLNLRSVRLYLLSFRVVTALVGERLLIPWFTPMVSSLDQAFTIPTAGSRVGSAHSAILVSRASTSRRSSESALFREE